MGAWQFVITGSAEDPVAEAALHKMLTEFAQKLKATGAGVAHSALTAEAGGWQAGTGADPALSEDARIAALAKAKEGEEYKRKFREARGLATR